jgi:hypothetical protein
MVYQEIEATGQQYLRLLINDEASDGTSRHMTFLAFLFMTACASSARSSREGCR